MIFLPRDLARTRDQSVKLLYGEDSHKVCHYSIKFGGHRHSGGRNIMIFVCHVTLQDH